MNKAEEHKSIGKELAEHAPFTAFGAVTGILILVIILLTKVPDDVSDKVFHIFHPTHIFLSALVTTAIYRLHQGRKRWAFLIGYIGAVGICSLSDVILPYLGGSLLGVEEELHICFIEHWWLVNPVAFLGIAVGYLKPITKFPHAGHILVSTWASLFYLTAFGTADWYPLLPLIFLVLFIAVWLPCCLSDIVFPLLFVRKSKTTHQVLNH